MSDANFEIRSKLGNFFRGYTHYIEEKSGDRLEFTLYMVINGSNQRIDWTFDLTKPAAQQLEEFLTTFRIDIAAMWMLSRDEQFDYMFGKGKFESPSPMTLTLTDCNGEVLASIKEE